MLIVNGLGTVKYEELFVLFRYLTDILAAEGVEVVSPLCGELVTSLDMGGRLGDADVGRRRAGALWNAPASTPAFTRGNIALEPARPAPTDDRVPPTRRAATEPVRGDASPASREAAALGARSCSAKCARRSPPVPTNSVTSMRSPATATTASACCAASMPPQPRPSRRTPSLGVGEQLRRAGAAWSDRAGGTSGALWGAALEAMGDALSRTEPDAAALAEAIHAGRTRIEQLGGAELGDKTLVDALIPFDDEFRRRIELGAGIPDAMRDAAAAAADAAEATAALTPGRGGRDRSPSGASGTPTPAPCRSRSSSSPAAHDEWLIHTFDPGSASAAKVALIGQIEAEEKR